MNGMKDVIPLLLDAVSVRNSLKEEGKEENFYVASWQEDYEL